MRKQTNLWTTKNGRKIRICDMEDDHLDNTISMLERYGKAKENYLISSGYEALCCLQGECAIMSVEQDLMYLEEHGLDPCEIHPLYENLLNEKRRREAT